MRLFLKTLHHPARILKNLSVLAGRETVRSACSEGMTMDGEKLSVVKKKEFAQSCKLQATCCCSHSKSDVSGHHWGALKISGKTSAPTKVHTLWRGEEVEVKWKRGQHCFQWEVFFPLSISLDCSPDGHVKKSFPKFEFGGNPSPNPEMSRVHLTAAAYPVLIISLVPFFCLFHLTVGAWNCVHQFCYWRAVWWLSNCHQH